MRLMMTTDVVGGVWTYTQELVEGIIQAGHEVVLVSLGRAPSAEQQSWAERLSYSAANRFRYVPTEFKLEWMPDSHEDLEESSKFLLRLIEEERPDILHSNQFCYGALPCAIPRVVVAHSDVVSWGHACHAGAPPADVWLEQYRFVVGNGLEFASAVVAPTAWMRQQLALHYGVSATTCQVIANGRRLQLEHSRPRRMQGVTAGRLWDEGKNIGLLTNALLAVPVFVAGERTWNESGNVNAPAAGQPGKANAQVHFLGALRSGELQALMQESALYIATSIYEPFGLAPLEAALAGCALVLSDIPTFRELWGDTAVFFDPQDAQALARAVNRLVADRRWLDQLAAAGQARAIQLYSAEIMTARYLDLYARVQSRAEEDACAA
ncbi:MAG: glycosyltransferase family 4 protein [Acidobacteriaceae bacterium]